MLHTEILEQIRKEKEHQQFIYPYYGKYCISDVGPSILSYFGAPHTRATFPEQFFPDKKRFKRVLLFMIDGFGLDQYEKYNIQIPFLNRIREKAEVYPITSVFPSTTPAALTSIHTGLTPQEHGLPEWTVYFEEFGRVIETFPFKPVMTQEREVLLKMGGKPEMLYSGPTIYQQLKDHGIPSYMFINHEYSTSAYSRMTQLGSNVVAFSSYDDLFIKLQKTLKEEKKPGYFFVYWSHIDSTQHVFGPDSPEHIMSLESFSKYMMEQLLGKLTVEDVNDVVFMMISDHGHTSIKGEDIIFLNNYLPVERNLRYNPSKQLIQPTGSPHDVFLHVYKPKITETLEFLRNNLEGKADVLLIEEALQRGLFGINVPKEQFLKRVGDILILPYPGFHVWYKYDPSGHYGQRGIHGGLTKTEMLVPFVVSPLRDLKKD